MNELPDDLKPVDLKVAAAYLLVVEAAYYTAGLYIGMWWGMKVLALITIPIIVLNVLNRLLGRTWIGPMIEKIKLF